MVICNNSMIQNKKKMTSALAIMLVVGMALSSAPLRVSASSHREAPLIASDPQADSTDFYAFVSPDRPDTVTFVASYVPFGSPNGAPNFYPFGTNVLYSINVDNNGDAIPDIVYNYEFKTTVQNPNTFLYNTGPIKSLTDPNWNVRQTYTLTRVQGGQSTVLGTDIPVPPVNIGPKSTSDYAALSNAAIQNVGGLVTFAGSTDDAFFVDLGSIFDLLTIRKLPGNKGGGVDGVSHYNVQTIALQVPIAQLTKNATIINDPKVDGAVIGAWTTASRRQTRVVNTDGSRTDTGDWVQVSRLGAPLVNEVVIPRGLKDRFNASKPVDDGQFANYVTDPELGKLFKAIYNIQVPPQAPFGDPSGRDDLVAIFLTGVAGLTQPTGVKPSEELRLNVAIKPTANPNRMGVVGGDTQGYPNGRRLADDVTDISLQAVAGVVYPLFHPTFKPDALASQLGDGVDANDKSFRNSFPYVALPWQGYDHAPYSMPGNSGNTPPAMYGGCGCDLNVVALRIGTRGTGVGLLQQCLRDKGIFKAVVTSYYGPITDAAVRVCQSR